MSGLNYRTGGQAERNPLRGPWTTGAPPTNETRTAPDDGDRPGRRIILMGLHRHCGSGRSGDDVVQNRDCIMADAKTNPSKRKSSWRDVLPIHPAAALFPMMTPDELKTLGEDIRKQGQRVPIAVWKAQKRSRPELLDGRNRLDAMEAVGIGIRVDYEGTERDPRVRLFKHVPPDGPWWPIEIAELTGLDPYDVVLSANIHRRHLTPQQKRDLIAKVLKATPEKI